MRQPRFVTFFFHWIKHNLNTLFLQSQNSFNLLILGYLNFPELVVTIQRTRSRGFVVCVLLGQEPVACRCHWIVLDLSPVSSKVCRETPPALQRHKTGGVKEQFCASAGCFCNRCCYNNIVQAPGTCGAGNFAALIWKLRSPFSFVCVLWKRQWGRENDPAPVKHGTANSPVECAIALKYGG